MTKEELIEAIGNLKKEKNAIILAHYYSRPEVQDIADFIGDSLELSKKAGTTSADMIVFAGVHFMAETASLISPDKKVLVPALGAGCSLADGATGKDLSDWKAKNPDGVIVSYVNTTAEVKSFTDICCTSSNALSIVDGIPDGSKVYFVPDRNLGAYIAKKTGKKMDLHNGCCYVHDKITTRMVLDMLEKYPEADVLIHPESSCSCDPQIMNHPRCFLYSTSGILRHAKESPKKQFVIATEMGILHKLETEVPGKEFIPISQDAICEYMKLSTLENIYEALKEEKYEVKVSGEMAKRAVQPILKMMQK